MDLTFAGAGFMGAYYFGVVDCLNKYVPRERINRVAGTSAGALIAAYYLMDLPLGDCLREIVDLLEDVRRRPLGVFDRSNQIVDVLPRALDKMFPEDAHKRVADRLYVCMTRLKDKKKIIVNQFETRKDLIDALNCSSFIPVWSGNHVSTYKGVKHIDGIFSDNLPTFDEHTIRICCFAGPSDISPYDRLKAEALWARVSNMPVYVNFANCRRALQALFPPPMAFVVGLLERGFHDTKDFILTNDLIQCDVCYNRTDPREQPIYAQLSPTISPSASFRNLSQLQLESHSACELVWNGVDSGWQGINDSRAHLFQNEAPPPEQSERMRANGDSSPPKGRRHTSKSEHSAGPLGGRYTLAPDSLPSCPPSPNLNRHCNACIRLRQEARVDRISVTIRQAIDQYCTQKTTKYKNGLASKLTSPFRWIRQFGVKSSYKLEVALAQTLAHQAHHLD